MAEEPRIVDNTGKQVTALNLSRARNPRRIKYLTRSAAWHTPSRRIRVRAELREQPDIDLFRAILQETPGATLSHLSAAALHGFPMPWLVLTKDGLSPAPLRGVHVASRDNQRAPRRKGIYGYRLILSDHEITRRDGIRVTTRERTALDLARWLSIPDLVAVLDHLFSSGPRNPYMSKEALVDREDFRKYLESQVKRRGLPKLRQAFERSVTGADSAPETRLRLALADAGLPEFLANAAVCNEQGVPTIWPDLSNHRFKVGVEYEGSHHLEAEQLHRDATRDLRMQLLGWVQVKITKADMRNADVAVNKVRMALLRNGWHATSSLK